ncbi:conjugal transfer protein TraD [Gilliamella sp. B2894]|uniref:conjugal transfer protein TraD n=1 Tax=Gilliamella sp. B2894 TaxID=2817978 RepID=UPI00226AB36D|nr:conjugal transfer protein TraD [Gilliamella sp. B2894]MCX8657353.1 conjugal transfer protein TraD [Gilliamella sp. B2894]
MKLNNEKDALLDVVNQKMNDLKDTLTLSIEFSPDEADLAGAFKEDALSVQDAEDSSIG